MVNEISGVGLGQSVVAQPGSAATQRFVGAVDREDFGLRQSGIAPDRQTPDSAQVAGAYALSRVHQETLNKAASVVREMGSAVAEASQLLGKVENKLDEIVKMFPPYPIDNPMRVTLLNKVDGLRKQIDQLTYPPPEPLAVVGRLIGAKVDAASKDGHVVKDRIWDLPALDPKTASDADVSKAHDQVKAMRVALQDLQTGMWQDVVNFVKSADSPEVQNEASGVRGQMADLNDRGIGRHVHQLVQATESKSGK